MRLFVVLSFLLVCLSTVPARAQEIKAAFIYITNPDDKGWSYQHDFGRRVMEALYSDNITTNFTSDVWPEATYGAEVINMYIDAGFDLILGTSVGYTQPLLEAANAHPDRKFMSVFNVANGLHNNLAFVNPYIYQPIYLTGVVAGGTSPGPYCYAAPMNIPEVMQAVDAYLLGLRVFQPNATVEYAVCDQWRNAELEEELGRWMVARGCQVYASYMDGFEGQKAFVDAGGLAVGVNSDLGRVIGSELLLTSAAYSWEVAYAEILESVLDGTAWPSGAWVLESGLETGLVELTPPTSRVPSSVRARAAALQSKIISGDLKVFTGPIYDDKGDLQIPEGVSLNDKDVFSVNYLVDGVNKLPNTYAQVSCQAGYFTDPFSLVCTKCPAGSEQPAAGVVVFECTPCPAGTAALSEGTAKCEACQPGQYKTLPGAGSCSSCPAGTYSDANNTVECTPCPAGSFAASGGAGSCQPCPIGQYQRNPGADSCMECPVHATTLATGSDDKKMCMCITGYQQASDAEVDAAGQPTLECIAATAQGMQPTAGIAVGVVILVVNIIAVAGVLAFFFVRVFRAKKKKGKKHEGDATDA